MTVNGVSKQTSRELTFVQMLGDGLVDESRLIEDLIVNLQEVESEDIALVKTEGLKQDRIRKILEIVATECKKRITMYLSKAHKETTGKKPRDRKTDALIIRGTDYAEAVKAVKDSIATSGSKPDIYKMRKGKEGELVIVTNKGHGNQVKEILHAREGMKVSLKRAEDARTKRTVLIRNIDDDLTKEQINDALNSMRKDGRRQDRIIDIIKGKEGRGQSAKVTCDEGEATSLLESGRVRLGIMLCSVAAWAEVKLCHRCWNAGHTWKDCEETDRRDLCRRCGQPGHKAKECKNEAHCALCDKQGHRAGTNKCPLYKTALKEAKKGKIPEAKTTTAALPKTPREKVPRKKRRGNKEKEVTDFDMEVDTAEKAVKEPESPSKAARDRDREETPDLDLPEHNRSPPEDRDQ